VTIAEVAELLHKDAGRDHVATFALNGLDKNGRDLLGRQRGLEELVFDEAGAAESKLFAVLRRAGTCAVDVG